MPIQTYTEIINKREAEYVTTLSYEDFFKYFPRDVKDSENGCDFKPPPNEVYFKMINNYLKLMMRNNFKKEFNYQPNENKPNGRINAKCSISLQRMHKPLRHFLTNGLYRDYDMKNAHPTILLKMCEAEGLPTMYQKNYIENRDKLLKENNTDKRTILIKLNSDNARANGSWNKELKGLLNEWNNVKKYFHKQNEDKYIQTNQKNPISSIINKMMCHKENEILQQALPDADYIVPLFDGFMTNKEIDITTLPNEICSWDEKPIDTDVKVPDEFIFVPEAEVVKENGYEDMKEEFEKKHAKIINKSVFVMVNDDELIFKTKADLIVSYEHLFYRKWVMELSREDGGYYVKAGFIKDWFKDPDIRIYDDIECFPNVDKCPDNILNTWTGFAVERMNSCEINEEHIEVFKKHILILCDNDAKQQTILLNWIAHIFQHPDAKSFNPVLISAEGCGKGTLLKIISRLCGRRKVLETADPLEYVFGKFNDTMTDTFVVNINECRKKDMIEVIEKLKELIADPTLWIQGKGVKKFSMTSHHRFITTTNNEDPIPTKEGDRRNHIIRASDELKGDIKYFKDINKLIEDDEFIYSIYLYLMNLPDVPRVFDVEHFPKTEYQEELKEASKDYAVLWLEDFVRDCLDDKDIKDKSNHRLSSQEVFSIYRQFSESNKLKCERNIISFMKHLSLMKMDGIEKVTGSKGMRMTKFDLNVLAKKFMIGCQIDAQKLDNKEDDDEEDDDDEC